MPRRTYGFTGDWQKFNVPKNVKHVSVTLEGAGSGGRRAGRVTGRMRVNERQTLFILVGGKGKGSDGSQGGSTAFGGGGRGGDGRGNPGGDGGGGASAIRVNSRTGVIRAVAGGAGGNSGDGGKGGLGGGTIGGHGSPGVAGNGDVGNATGGTQEQGGNGGTSAGHSNLNGENARNVTLSRGGDGGGPRTPNTYGGGGGGGGYYPGGGGQAGWIDEVPGGGGGAGSNYVGGIFGYTNEQGEGGTGNGSVTITWDDPPPANQPPSPPTQVKIGNKDAVSEHETNSTGSVKISAKLVDPDKKGDTRTDRVRLIVQYSPNRDFSRHRTERSELVHQEAPKTKNRKKRTGRAEVTLRGLRQNTRYYCRLYARDDHGNRSVQYTSIDFWTNRFPTAPDQVQPQENATVSELSSVVFEWQHRDPDERSSQRSYELQWRRARTPTIPAGRWHSVQDRTNFDTYVANPGAFKANTFYEWRVRTRDQQGKWGPFSYVRSFFVTGASAPPMPLDPVRDEAVNVNAPVTFHWKFRDPDQADEQTKADLRYRPVDTPDWFTVLGTQAEPGAAEQWTLPEHTFMPNAHYEWQVRTTDSLASAVSAWSESAFFRSVYTPGIRTERRIVPSPTYRRESLGCGHNEVFIFDRGGTRLRGKIEPVKRVNYSRQRDDIANCLVETNGFGPDCGSFLGDLRCWMHEVVVFRDGVRVWEGPITRIAYTRDSVEIEAKDVMAYVYRRIMRQGYNDSYEIVNGQQLGLSTVVERAVRITMNALAPDDPNLLQFLTSLDFPDDARTSRSVPDFSRTAWEEVDDLAATGGLDYTTIGRRIVFNDTHRPLGRLMEMREENFSNPLIVTEYGMQTATAFGVTNNNGVWGLAEREHVSYGLVEQLASAYGETEGGTQTTLTAEAREALEKTLSEQAERNIAGRYPTPVVVRVPDNSTISPDTPVGINQLVPGVWIPLRATATVREVAQWQKLDLMTVEQTNQGERITVTMSPAPNGGEDPDAEVAATEEATA